MKKVSAELDYFAEIATAVTIHARPGLTEPARAAAPDITLPLTPGSAPEERPHAAKLGTAAELAEALALARERHAEFLRDYAPPLPRTRERFDLKTFSWRIERPEDRADFHALTGGAGDWETVTIPHYGPPLGKACTLYRVEFDLPGALFAKEVVVLRFRGVDYKCEAYLNGVCVGRHEGFFDEFEFNCTGVARQTGNVLLVRVENDYTMLGSHKEGAAINGDKIYAATGLGYDDPKQGWHHCPAGMGIYNTVHFEGRPRLAITDLWVRPLPAVAEAELRFEVENLGPTPNEDARFLVSVFGLNFPATLHRDHPHRPHASTERGFGDLDGDHASDIPGLMGPGVSFVSVRLPMPQMRIWDLDTPWLYQAQVKILTPDGTLLDAAACPFGMRSFIQDEHSTPKGKFYLNGREIRLRGANTMGHLERCIMLGNFDQLRDDILLAKLTHMNFLRLTQRPVHKEVYEWCDRLGLLLQTDMPMFASARRNQLIEITRQAARMERHVRAHPSNILVSYINEPRPAAASQPHRFMLRPELERMFLLCSEVVRQENPERVIKCVDGDYDPPSAQGMPDNHCYCGWYIGHGVDLGALHNGAWLPVKPGWHYGCGEFGAEGLDSYEVMQKYYPESWKPASPEAPWTPAVISESQSWNFHFLWYVTPVNAREWIEASQDHQTWIVRLMTEAYRRKADMNTFAIHLFIDAWPAGWMKTLMDVDRVPKKAWFAYRDALTPLAVNLRCDRLQAWSGEVLSVEMWVCNDHAFATAGARLVYEVGFEGKIIAHGEIAAQIAVCAPRGQGMIEINLPATTHRGRLTVAASLVSADGVALHENEIEVDVFPAIPAAGTCLCVPESSPETSLLLGKLGLNTQKPITGERPVILLATHEAYESRRSEIDAAVKNGATALFVKLAPGTYDIGGVSLMVRKAGMGPRHFVSGRTGHPLLAGLEPRDFKFWHFDALGHASPLLLSVLEGPAWTPIVQSGDGGWLRPWAYTPAVVEHRDGRGVWRVCQLELGATAGSTPTSAILARRLLGLDPAV